MMKIDLSHVPGQLKKLRIKKGISQIELAEKLGVNQVTISQYETGKIKLTLEKAVQITELLECTINELLGQAEVICEYSPLWITKPWK